MVGPAPLTMRVFTTNVPKHSTEGSMKEDSSIKEEDNKLKENSTVIKDDMATIANLIM